MLAETRLFVLIILGFSVVHCDIELDCDAEHCLNQDVEYSCQVTESHSLTFIIIPENENETQLPTATFTRYDISSDIPINDMFLTSQLSTIPIVSNISFTVQSSINGYIIICKDHSGKSQNCTIKVAEPPSSPVDVMLDTPVDVFKLPPSDTFQCSGVDRYMYIRDSNTSYAAECRTTRLDGNQSSPYMMLSSYANSSLRVSWSPPMLSSQCVSSYIVNSTTVDNAIKAFHTSVDLNVEQSFIVHTVAVAAVDFANRTGNYTAFKKFMFNVPLKVKSIDTTTTNDSTSSNITVRWNCTLNSEVAGDGYIAPILCYILTHNGTMNGNFQTIRLSETNYTIVGVPQGRHCSIYISAENAIGVSLTINTTIYIDGESQSVSSVESTSALAGTSTTLKNYPMNTTIPLIPLDPKINETPITTGNNNLNLSLIIPIGGVSSIVLCILSLLPTLYICWKKLRNPKKPTRASPDNEATNDIQLHNLGISN